MYPSLRQAAARAVQPPIHSLHKTAEALRWTEYSLQSFPNILLGLTLILYGLAIVLGTVYPRWLGWIAAGSAVAWIVHGLMVPYNGFFDSIPRGWPQVLMYLWVFIVAVLVWRITRPELAPPEPTTPPANPR